MIGRRTSRREGSSTAADHALSIPLSVVESPRSSRANLATDVTVRSSDDGASDIAATATDSATLDRWSPLVRALARQAAREFLARTTDGPDRG